MHPNPNRSTRPAAVAVASLDATDLVVQTRLFHRPRTKLALWLAAGTFAAGVLAGNAYGQSTPAPATVGQDVIADRQFTGLAKRDGVVVRSGPGEGELAVATLNVGDEVVVVHRRDPFLRVLPPAGTFCLVPKARVNVSGPASGGMQSGRVVEAAPVRVGSTLSTSIGSTALRLAAGDEVRVIGEEGIYYKIEPPKLVFFYVSLSDLKKGREVRVEETPIGWVTSDIAPPAEIAGPAVAEAAPPIEVDGAADAAPPIAMADGSLPPDAIIEDGLDTEAEQEATPPAAPAATAALLAEFEALNERYLVEAEKPLVEQPLDTLEADYTALVASATEMGEAGDASAKALIPIIETRLKTIAIRRTALDDLRAVEAMRDRLADRQLELQAEKEELAERAERANVQVYEAVGLLVPSTLQVRGGTLFRLCDPETRRTVIYLKADGDAARTLAGNLQRFIGVRGEVVNDRVTEMKYVNVSESAVVAPEDVFGSVAARIIPPSLLDTATASADTGSATGER